MYEVWVKKGLQLFGLTQNGPGASQDSVEAGSRSGCLDPGTKGGDFDRHIHQRRFSGRQRTVDPPVGGGAAEELEQLVVAMRILFRLLLAHYGFTQNIHGEPGALFPNFPEVIPSGPALFSRHEKFCPAT